MVLILQLFKQSSCLKQPRLFTYIFFTNFYPDYGKTIDFIFKKVDGRMLCGPRKNPVNLGTDSNHRANT